MANHTSPLIVRTAIKDLLKKHGMTYKDLGQYLSLSEGSVKQLMTRGHLTIEKIEVIAQRFGLTIVEFLQIAYSKEHRPSRISHSQEEILVEFPIAIHLMFLLGSGFSLQSAKERMQIEERKFQKALYILDRAQVVEIHPGGKVFIKQRAPYRFNKDGAIEKKLRAGYLDLLLQQISRKPDSNVLQRSFEMYVSDRLFTQIKNDLSQLIEKYAHLARIEAELDDKGRAFPITGLFFIKEFDGWGKFLRSLK